MAWEKLNCSILHGVILPRMRSLGGLISQAHLVKITFSSLSRFIFKKEKVLKFVSVRLNRTKCALESTKMVLLAGSDRKPNSSYPLSVQVIEPRDGPPLKEGPGWGVASWYGWGHPLLIELSWSCASVPEPEDDISLAEVEVQTDKRTVGQWLLPLLIYKAG